MTSYFTSLSCVNIMSDLALSECLFMDITLILHISDCLKTLFRLAVAIYSLESQSVGSIT